MNKKEIDILDFETGEIQEPRQEEAQGEQQYKKNTFEDVYLQDVKPMAKTETKPTEGTYKVGIFSESISLSEFCSIMLTNTEISFTSVVDVPSVYVNISGEYTKGEIIEIIQPLCLAGAPANSKARLKDLGYFSCASTVDIRHVPFYEPCAILVLAGTKTLYEHGQPVTAEAGGVLTVPAPGSYDMRNAPDPRARHYEALIIPFTARLLDQLIRSHGLLHEARQGDGAVLKFAPDDTLHRSIAHYLTTVRGGFSRTISSPSSWRPSSVWVERRNNANPGATKSPMCRPLSATVTG